jgi:hypothetical protein
VGYFQNISQQFDFGKRWFVDTKLVSADSCSCTGFVQANRYTYFFLSKTQSLTTFAHAATDDRDG